MTIEQIQNPVFKIICDQCGKESGFTDHTDESYFENMHIHSGWARVFKRDLPKVVTNNNALMGHQCPGCKAGKEWKPKKVNQLKWKGN